MKGPIKIALVALAVAGGSVLAGCVVPGGEIAFAYRDGYWDRGHQWHAWRDEYEATRFRAQNRDHFYDRRHDEDRDGGWRDNDRYWDRR